MKIYKNIRIVYEDNHIIVVEKPAGILSQKDKTNDQSLLDIIKEYIKVTYHKPGNVYAGLVHRLDKQVSGIMVFAKTSKAASRLFLQFKSHEVVKLYCAAVETKITPCDNQWHLLEDSVVRIHNTTHVGVTKNAVPAALQYKVIYHDEPFSLVLVNLYTGKKHQIRAQLSHHAMPIANDTKYGAHPTTGDNQIALHACFLQFIHPTTKKVVSFYSPPYGIFTVLFKELDIDSIIKQALQQEDFK